MGIDWEYIGEGIAEVGSMVSNTIMDKYRADQAQKQFIKNFEEKLRAEEPFKIAANDRVIERMKMGVEQQFQLHKGMVQYSHKHAMDMQANLNSEALMKKRESIMKARKPIDMLWVSQLDRIKAKTERQEDITDEEATFIEHVDDPIVRATFNNLRNQKKQTDRQFSIKRMSLEKQNKMLENQLINYSSLMERRNELTDIDKFKLREKIDGMELAIAQNFSALDAEIDEEKNRGIWNRKTGEVDPRKKEKFLNKHPQFRSRFDEMDVAVKVLKSKKALYKEFFESKTRKVKPKEKLTEEDIKKYMEQTGKTKEQILKEWAAYEGK